MCEEIRHASTVVPQRMIASLLINRVLAFGMLVSVLFCMGDFTAALQTPTEYLFIKIFTQATAFKAGATVMTSIIIILAFCAIIAALAGSSRMTWSFARNRGLLGWRYLSKVRWTGIFWITVVNSQTTALPRSRCSPLTTDSDRRACIHSVDFNRHFDHQLLTPRSYQHPFFYGFQRRCIAGD